MVRQIIQTAKIAATFVGTVVGAGFASGQELLQFFLSYGTVGFWGILLTGVLFAWLGSRLLTLGYRLQASGYHEIIRYLCGRRIAVYLDNLIALFLFGGLVIMLAGVGTVFRDFLSLPFSAGLGAISLAILATAWFGVKGIASVNLFITPFLLFFTVMTGVNSLKYHHMDFSLLDIPPEPALQPAPHWLLAALLYAAYNLVLGATVMGPLGKETPSAKVRLLGGSIGGGILAVLALFIGAVIALHHPEILDYEVPMLYVSSCQENWSHFAYAIAVLKSMYSSALASLFGCVTKLQTAAGIPFRISLILVVAASLCCSQFGFANLIGAIYPLFGYIALYFTLKLSWYSLRYK